MYSIDYTDLLLQKKYELIKGSHFSWNYLPKLFLNSGNILYWSFFM